MSQPEKRVALLKDGQGAQVDEPEADAPPKLPDTQTDPDSDEKKPKDEEDSGYSAYVGKIGNFLGETWSGVTSAAQEIFDPDRTTLAESSTATTMDSPTLDAQVFMWYVLFILCFPFSSIFYAISHKCFKTKRVSLTLSLGVTAMYTLYWIYFIVYQSTNHDQLFPEELYLPLFFLILLAIDTSLALSNPTFSLKLAAVKTFTQRYKESKRRLKISATHWGHFTDVLAQLVMVTPTEESCVAAREHLKQFNIKLSLAQGDEYRGRDTLEKWSLLYYDRSTPATRGGDGMDGPVLDVDEEKGQSFYANSEHIAAFEQAMPDSMTVDLGESYQKQCFLHPDEISLEGVADQLIWGVRPNRDWCHGWCLRFFSIEKFPAILVGLAYVGFTAALPTLTRIYDENLDDMGVLEWILAVCYMAFVTILGAQVIGFFLMILEVYKQEYARMLVLATLLSPAEAKEYCLPVLDFRREQHIMAWVALRQYVTTFSAKSVKFFGQRLVTFAVALVLSLMYIAWTFSEGKLSRETLMTLFTVATFCVFVAYFLAIVSFGVLANGQQEIHVQRIAEKLITIHETEFMFKLSCNEKHHTPQHHQELTEKLHELSEVRILIENLLSFAKNRPQLTLLNAPLHAGLFGIIGTGLVTLAGSVAPILVEAFGG